VQAQTKSIVAVEPLVCDVVQAIAPPSTPVTCLINREQDVHNLKISPKQAQKLNSASQIITLGKEMTPAIKNWLNNPITVVVGVSAIKIEKHQNGHDSHRKNADIHLVEKHDGHDHHAHGGLDPHVWHNPRNTIKIGKVIYENIKKDYAFSDKIVLSKRYQTFEAIIEDLYQWIEQQVSTIPPSQRTIVSKHKSMEYFGDAFGIQTISLLDFIGHSSSLRPQNISSVLRVLKEGNVKVIFAEQKPPSKLLRNLSKQTSIPISSKQIFVDGLMPKGNTISAAVHNTCTIVNSLGGLCFKKEGKLLESRWNSLIVELD